MTKQVNLKLTSRMDCVKRNICSSILKILVDIWIIFTSLSDSFAIAQVQYTSNNTNSANLEYAQKPPLTDTICSNDALRAQTEIMAGRLSFIYNGDYRFGLPQEVRKLCDSMKLSFKSSGYNDIISNQMRWCYEVLMDAALTDTFGHEFKEKLIARAKENLKDSFKFSETFYLGSACEIPTKLHYRKEFSDQLYNLITDDTSFQNEWGIPINADLYIQKTGEVRNINIREEYLPKALVEKIKDLVYRYIMMDYRYWQAGSIFGVPVNTVITVNFTIVYKEL